jgi:hypothetical protein
LSSKQEQVIENDDIRVYFIVSERVRINERKIEKTGTK